MIKREALEPTEREEIPFHGHTIIAVKLPDNRIAVVLRLVCEALCLDPQGQTQRIERTPAIANELVRVRMLTKGGIQPMPALTLRGFPTWILGIHPSELKDDNPKEAERIRQIILAYQVEAVDVLYNHFAQKGRLALTQSHAMVPAEAPTKPMQPEVDASHENWAAYHEQMARWHQWQRELVVWRESIETKLEQVEQRQDEMEVRMESMEAITDLIPEILERLGPETLTPQHQHQVQVLAKQLHQAISKPYPTIYDGLRTAFQKPRYQDILEDEWPQVEQWFKVQIERARKPSR